MGRNHTAVRWGEVELVVLFWQHKDRLLRPKTVVVMPERSTSHQAGARNGVTTLDVTFAWPEMETKHHAIKRVLHVEFAISLVPGQPKWDL